MPDSLNPMEILRSLGCGHFQILNKVEGGADTKIWKAVANESFAALRVFRSHQAFGLKFELEAMILASAAGVPVPKIFASGTHNGLPCMLIEWIDGRSMLESFDKKPGLETLSQEFGKLNAKLHQHTIQPDGRCLVHLDYHPLNVIVKKGRIVGVIDWTNSEIGNPMQDVARTISLLICTPLLSREDRVFARKLRRTARNYLIGYGETTDLKRHIREATKHLADELDFHVRENGLVEPTHARRMIAKWYRFNQ
jgi:aminoglycoside phosphotransferase (APT) family kinase protein